MANITTNVGALIPINDNNGKKAVNARDLHAFLESKQDFSTWIKNRIEKYDLEVFKRDIIPSGRLHPYPSGYSIA